MLTLALVLAVAACPQRIQVVAPSVHSTTASLTVDECGKRVLGPWRAHVGRSGLSAHHLEGDGTTPLGRFPIGPVLYGLEPNPGVRLRYHRIVCGDWWDEDPASRTYNTFRHTACGAKPPFGADSEALWKPVVAYNVTPVIAGRGSAIFLHIDTGHATNGCVSLPRPQLLRVLRRLRPGASITIRA